MSKILTKKAMNMSKIDLRKLEFSPDNNPLMQASDVVVKKKYVKSGIANKTLIDSETGEVQATSVVHQIEEKDDAHFVKVFAAGVAASYELNRTAARVFQAILREYEKSPLTRGFVDTVYIAWFGNGLAGEDIGMSEKTFQRGLKMLLEKGFLSPRSPNQFWVNPALFFKGDRVLFIKEYRKKQNKSKVVDDKTVGMFLDK